MRQRRSRRVACRAVAGALALTLAYTQSALAAQTIGDARVVVNDVRGVIGTAEPTVLRAGIDVFQDETIRTGPRSASRVLFQDKTSLDVGASSEVKLDRFVFDPDPSKSAVALSIARGVVRFATGGLPKSAYRIVTPTATIGVRGTIVRIMVEADGTTIISVEDGYIEVSAQGQTVTVGPGASTTVPPGSPPAPPYQTPPDQPPVTEMDALLADAGRLPPGPPAGMERIRNIPLPVAVGAAAVVIAGIILLSSSGGEGHTASTTGVPTR